MKIFLDDVRETPPGWERTFSVEETIELLMTRKVTELSLDNDLGDGYLEGFKVLDWLEMILYYDMDFPLPQITIHSANSVRAPIMRLVASKLENIRQQQIGGR